MKVNILHIMNPYGIQCWEQPWSPYSHPDNHLRVVSTFSRSKGPSICRSSTARSSARGSPRRVDFSKFWESQSYTLEVQLPPFLIGWFPSFTIILAGGVIIIQKEPPFLEWWLTSRVYNTISSYIENHRHFKKLLTSKDWPKKTSPAVSQLAPIVK